MRFLVDENLPDLLVELLKQYGHEAVHVYGIGLQGADDVLIGAHARREGLCLITRDRDFSNVLEFPPGEYSGLVVIRTRKGASLSLVLGLLREHLLERKDILEGLSGGLVIVEPGGPRMWAETEV